MPLPPLGAFLGRCRMRTHMAAGRNSAVYLGELWDLRLPVAVKVPAPRRRGDRPVLAAHLRAEFRFLAGSAMRTWPASGTTATTRTMPAPGDRVRGEPDAGATCARATAGG